MKAKVFLTAAGILLLTAVFLNSCDTTTPVTPIDDDPDVTENVIEVNKFIQENMDIYYLWNEEMPDLDYTKQPDPFDFFDTLLYKPTDRWSYITDDYEALAQSYSGVEESMGHSYILYKYSNSDGLFGIIQFVYPGSPAAEAGLKRGDLFTAIDEVDLTLDNYISLLDQDSYLLTVAELQGNTVVPVKDVNLTAKVITENPILYYDTLNVDGTRIGYLVYKNFLENYNDSLSEAFSWLKSMGINEMILDLRYNNGGSITALRYLASILAPVQQINNADVLIKDQYNAILTQYYNNKGISNETRFTFVTPNLDLSRLYVLTGHNSASASEALITGLDPYMDVTTLGDTTRGKYTGAYVIPEEDLNWAIQPIVFKYSNSVGYTDFPGGLYPDYVEDDDLFHQLGDRNEGLLASAIEKITGVQASVAAKSARIKLNVHPVKAFDNNQPREAIPLLKEKPELE